MSEPERGAFGNHCEFFLTSLGLAVGLGNIWRFPYVCYSYGGGSFLFPYLLMLLLVGLPIFFMEMVLGQFAGLSSTKIFSRIAPGLKGMGYGMVAIPTIVNFYYTVIMAYSFYFLFMGLQSELPWGHCTDPEINTPNCYSLLDAGECNNTQIFWNRTCTEIDVFCHHFNQTSVQNNNTHCFSAGDQFPLPVQNVSFRVSSSEEFWYNKVLGINVIFTREGTTVDLEASSWSTWGDANWKIAGCLLLCWALVCASLIKGVQSYGKVVYFTTLFPYIVLTTLLGYSATLDGFMDGIKFYLTPDLEKIQNLEVWTVAASQIFYSLGVAQGSQLILSSFNTFRNNCHRDALLIGVCNSLTSIYAGFVVFGVVGYIANKKGVPVESVVDEGPGLAFVVYPEAVASMAVAPLFSFLFFFMLTLLAISSVCGSWEAFIAALLDEFPKLRTKRTWVMISSCFVAFLAGLPICFDSGFFLFTTMDRRSANAAKLMGLLELVCISWIYGADKFFMHIVDMGMKIPGFMKIYWKSTWMIIAPIMVTFLTIYSWIQSADDYFLDYTFPPAVQAMAWGIELFPIFIVIAFGVQVVVSKWRQGESIAFFNTGPLLAPKAKWGARTDQGIQTVVEEEDGNANEAYERE